MFAKINKPEENTYEVPIEIKKPELGSKSDKNNRYEVQVNEDNGDFNFKIIRKSTGTVMWVKIFKNCFLSKLFKKNTIFILIQMGYKLGTNYF